MSTLDFIAIGGGPGGIATAIELEALGLPMERQLVLEKGEASIAAIRQFYPEKKMTIANYKGLATSTEGVLKTFPDLTKQQTIDYFDDLIQKYHVPMRYKAEAYKVSLSGSEFEVFVGRDIFRARSIAIGIGILGRPNKPTYKLPATLRTQILFDITSQKVQNERVAVIGGGDTSSEYAQILVEEGNKVTLICRAATPDRMMEQNRTIAFKLVEQGKLDLRFGCSVGEVRDDSGKPQLVFSGCDTPPETFDRLVYAIGGTTPLNFLRMAGIQCDNNWPQVGASGETNIPGLFLVGDLAVGKTGGSIITAYNSAHRSALKIFEYLGKMK